MIAARGLKKTYPGTQQGGSAIDGVDLTVEEGEIYVLLGPSGCGKTTFLRCLAGVETPDAGEIKLGGEVVYSSTQRVMVPCQHRDIGLVFQSYAIWPHMTVAQNIGYPIRYGRRHRVSDSEVRRRVEEVLAIVGLEGYGNRMATDLSGGQQQRVALARAVVHEPRVLLMDEPLSNLDARLRVQMRKQLGELLARLHITTVYVTHDQIEAFSLAQRVGVMRAGKIAQEGSPTEIYERPRTRFIAGFTGEMNWLDGVVEKVQSDKVWIRTPVGSMLAHGGQDIHGPGDDVVVGVRSGCLALCAASDAGINKIRGRVESVVFCGDWSLLGVRAGELLLEIIAYGHLGVPQIGAETVATVLPESVHVFKSEE